MKQRKMRDNHDINAKFSMMWTIAIMFALFTWAANGQEKQVTVYKVNPLTGNLEAHTQTKKQANPYPKFIDYGKAAGDGFKQGYQWGNHVRNNYNWDNYYKRKAAKQKYRARKKALRRQRKLKKLKTKD